MENLITNCPLCKEHSLHVVGESGGRVQQCINCGYVTSDKYKLDGTKKEDNEYYKKLTEDMRDWSKVSNDRLWIPSIMTLPFGMLYPFNDEDGNMKWSFAKMVEIPEEERKNFPIEGQKDEYHNKKYDTDNAEIYEEFVFAMKRTNDIAKAIVQNDHGSQVTSDGDVKIKIPKLKKIKND
tara:strand:- start:470 stop:1009 length:540 start_codon:yes stop_codon:yes gene_type:complete